MAGAWLCAAAVATLSSSAARGAGVRLIDAVKSGNTQTVSALLKQKTDVNAAEGMARRRCTTPRTATISS
jgi:hypothetical protein